VDGYGKRVLVVEDDQDVRLVMCLILSEAGYNVYEACDGLEALEALKKRRYDVVLSDYHMPKMDGLELLDLIQAMWPHTPVIMASSDCLLMEQAAKSLLAPAYAVVPKPFDSSKLLDVVRSAAGGVPKTLVHRPDYRPSYQAVA
jgi:CheY-like chemotaxis protein